MESTCNIHIILDSNFIETNILPDKDIDGMAEFFCNIPIT